MQCQHRLLHLLSVLSLAALLTAVACDSDDVPRFPAAPQGVQTTAVADTPGAIEITWTAPDAPDITIRIDRSDDGGTSWVTAGSVPASDRSYIDAGLDPRYTYEHRLTAIEDGKESEATPGPNPVAPEAELVITELFAGAVRGITTAGSTLWTINNFSNVPGDAMVMPGNKVIVAVHGSGGTLDGVVREYSYIPGQTVDAQVPANYTEHLSGWPDPGDLQILANGHLLVAGGSFLGTGPNWVGEYDITTTPWTQIRLETDPSPGTIQYLTDVTEMSNGTGFWVVDHTYSPGGGNPQLGRIILWDNAWTTTSIIDEPGTTPPAPVQPFAKPVQVLELPSGNLLVTEVNNNRMIEMDASGNYLREIGAGLMDNPSGMALLPNGHVLVAEVGLTGSPTISEWDLDTGSKVGDIAAAGPGRVRLVE